MTRLALVLLLNTLAYTMLYGIYTYAAKTMSGRVTYTIGVVAGTLLGSTIGQRLFK